MDTINSYLTNWGILNSENKEIPDAELDEEQQKGLLTNTTSSESDNEDITADTSPIQESKPSPPKSWLGNLQKRYNDWRNPPTTEEPEVEESSIESIQSRIKGFWDDTKNRIMPPKKPKTFWEKLEERCNLPPRIRLIGFLISCGIGILLVIGSIILLPQLIAIPFIGVRIFAISYTTGSIFCLLSTFFLAGPLSQIRQMATPKRIIPSITYLLSLFMTLFAALKMGNSILALLFIAVQIGSLAIYAVTYIPYSGTVFNFLLSNWFRNLIAL